MRVGIPVHNQRVSPVLDTAGRLQVIRGISAEQAETVEMIDLPGTSPVEQVDSVRRAGIGVLICGALSREMAWHLARWNIRVIPWIAGPVDAVANAFFQGDLQNEQFAMPGCGRRCRRRGRGRHMQRWREEEI